jgi:hypothetical protein
MKTLVTHVKPHLDDICGIWLLRTYLPGFSKAIIRFIPIDEKGGKTWDGRAVDSNPSVIHVGVARGAFDEHRGVKNASATTLVWNYLKRKGFAPRNRRERVALQRIVDYVYAEDTGRLKGLPHRNMMLPVLLSGFHESRHRTRIGFLLLQSLLHIKTTALTLENDWKRRIEFKTPWGRGVALKTTAAGSDDFSYRNGFVLVVTYNPKTGDRGIRAAADSRADLRTLARKVREREPLAQWYLHHSGKLLLCGDPVAPRVRRSKLALNELVALIKNLKR